ncbi:hypothetical protein [Actinomadura soli]|nr:hypothetical protein [Actinomadura soli]
MRQTQTQVVLALTGRSVDGHSLDVRRASPRASAAHRDDGAPV